MPDLHASIVIPARNAAPTLPTLLAALADQTVLPHEVFLVDDGSTDTTTDVARQAAQQAPALNLQIIQQKPAGPAAARNRGAHQATGEVLVFFDADCVPATDCLEQLLAPLAADPQLAGVQGAYISHQTSRMARFAQQEIEARYARLQRSKAVDFIATYAAAYRRDVFMAAGAFDERFVMASGEDADLSFRLAGRGCRLAFAPAARVDHQHPATLAAYLRQKYWRAYWRNLLYRRHPRRAVLDSYTPASVKLQTLTLLALGLTLPLLATGWPGALLPGLLLLFLLSTTLPFACWLGRRSVTLALLAVPLQLLRAAAYAAGAVHGLLRGLWTSPAYAAGSRHT